MSLNGSGVYVVNSAGQPVVSNTLITAAAFNAFTADIATALSTAIFKDGQQTLTANLPMGGFKLTGLGAGSASGNSLRYEQVNGIVTTAGDILYATAAGALARLAIGTAGYYLKTNSGATAPEWASLGMSPITNSLAGDVALNNTGNFFTGPTVAQGTSGTWFASGSVTVSDTAGAASIYAKLWDGTTVIAEGQVVTSGANAPLVIALSGYIAAPAGNIRISCRDLTSTSGVIIYNAVAGNKSSTLSAFRLSGT